jgi:hypothetical protein
VLEAEAVVDFPIILLMLLPLLVDVVVEEDQQLQVQQEMEIPDILME